MKAQKPDCNDVIDEYHSFLAATVKFLRDVSLLYFLTGVEHAESLVAPLSRVFTCFHDFFFSKTLSSCDYPCNNNLISFQVSEGQMKWLWDGESLVFDAVAWLQSLWASRSAVC